MHLVGFIIEICYDTRSYKRQICRCSFVNPKSIYMQLSYRPGEFHLLYTQQHKCTLIKVTALFRGRQSNRLNFLFLCGFETEYLNIATPINSLTLRLLMPYIHMERLFLMFLDHTQRRSTVGRTPLDE